MSVILVCPADRAAAFAREHRPSHVLGLASPGAPPEVVPADHHLALVFHDIAAPRAGLIAPSYADVAAILAFGRSWGGTRPLLVHCAMGISRSTAAALVLATDRWPEAAEVELARRLRSAAPCATPNALIVAIADDLLGRDGRLVAAVAAIGRGAEYVAQGGFALQSPRLASVAG